MLLDSLTFDNRYLNQLPGDPDLNNRRRQVYGACYSKVMPTPVADPTLLAYSPALAESLGLTASICESEDFRQVFVGNRLAKGMQPYAMCYGGHQFGQWAGQLGDGRAINLGELLSPHNQRQTLQLKGAGPTPYSRNADGLAVLRSSVREFLCSEAMHNLGIPTTRALSIILTGERVRRDMFYDGNPQYEPGAVVCRVAPSFVRFGSFQIFAARSEEAVLKQLVDFTIRNDFPHLGQPSRDVYLAWFTEVCQKTAEMIVHWQRVGFVHGVMNTDNMSILGLTIDYGPYGWLDNYDPNWTPNTTDAEGRRYRYAHQPQIAYWNLVQLANALYPLIPDQQQLQAALDSYVQCFEQGWNDMMAAKLGLQHYQPDSDSALVAETLRLLQQTETDYGIFFRQLALIDSQMTDDDCLACLAPAYYQDLDEQAQRTTRQWLQRYRQRCQMDSQTSEQRRQMMNSVNPKYTLRNYLTQQAIDLADQGDFAEVRKLLAIMQKPYDEQPEHQNYYARRPDWARHKPGCSMLSCSS